MIEQQHHWRNLDVQRAWLASLIAADEAADTRPLPRDVMIAVRQHLSLGSIRTAVYCSPGESLARH